ncbi:phage baseplate assembly protein V [Cereibacter azotoformans]|uniref:phage baseplate assembly protein V n=1 Tax=Cereibacter azotoformans TaxID=43057 RepID=UPI003B21CD7B
MNDQGFAMGDAERRLANVVKFATITAVDAGAARARVTFGGETESHWLQFSVARAGGARVWSPPTVGEQVMVLSPSGDTGQGVIIGSLPSNSNPSPSSDGGAMVLELGPVKITITAGGIEAVVSGVTLTLTGAGLNVDGGQVTHNGTNIGDTHQHPESIGSITGPPQ